MSRKLFITTAWLVHNWRLNNEKLWTPNCTLKASSCNLRFFFLLALILRDFICDHEQVDKTRICLSRKYNYTILACHCFLRRNKQSRQIRADMFWYFGKSHYVQHATAGTVSEARWRHSEFVGTSPVLLMRISFPVLPSSVQLLTVLCCSGGSFSKLEEVTLIM